DFPLLGTLPRWSGAPMRGLGAAINAMPRWLQEQVYIWSGWFEAVSVHKLQTIDAEQVAEWMVSLYPQRKYPAVAIGSANGAATHMWAAMGIPWLPQTFLVPVARSGVHPDEPQQDLEWGREPARIVLQCNPNVQLHHMHDPVQDRLMIQRMTYFRFKRLTLGPAYEAFLDRCLEPGGTIFLMDCRLQWPVTECGERHVFQFGAVGGATVDELQHGSERVSDYLKRYGSHRRKWEPPPVDRMAPEAEWGFAPAMTKDIERVAHRRHARLRRIVFEEPEHMSPLVANLYQQWNETRGITDRRLLVDSFILMEPYWTIRTGSAPFWMVFNKEPSRRALQAYLDQSQTFDEILMMLFSHGVESVGLPSIEQWREPLRRARIKGLFLGVDEHVFPRDFAVFTRYYFDLLRTIPARYPMPPALTVKELDEFLDHSDGRYAVRVEG
ncbi:MAG TPA: hypothetical protein VJV04_02990, partial [Nitrospiraceae bacterium]|nr:hypothetical protein [Nitrospiraceae bacterium]